jgi:hypothetical protein
MNERNNHDVLIQAFSTEPVEPWEEMFRVAAAEEDNDAGSSYASELESRKNPKLILAVWGKLTGGKLYQQNNLMFFHRHISRLVIQAVHDVSVHSEVS